MGEKGTRRAVRGMVKTALNLRLLALVLTVLWFPYADTDMLPLLSVLVALMAATSGIPLFEWDRIGPFILRHPSVIVADLVLSVAVLATVGLNTPFGLYVLATAFVAGLLWGWMGAGVISFALISSYLAGPMLAGEGIRVLDLFGTPLLIPGVAAMGAALRVLLLRQRASSEALAASSMKSATATERARLAREMHDTLAKTLHGLALSATAIPKLLEANPEQAAQTAASLGESAEEAAQQARALITDLRTDDLERPLGVALKEMAEEWGARTGVKVTTRVDDCAGMSPSVRYEVFCIVREALHNAHLHGDATAVVLALEDGEQVCLAVDDDGAGFVVPSDLESLALEQHFGVVGMKERAEHVGGSISITSRPDSGTVVEVVVPRQAAGEQPGQLPPGVAPWTEDEQ